MAASMCGWRWPWTLHQRLLTPSIYSRPSESTSLHPWARSMSSGSYSAICVKACQTWVLSQCFRSSSEGRITRRRALTWSRFYVAESVAALREQVCSRLRGWWVLPFDDDFLVEGNTEHGFGAVADDGE